MRSFATLAALTFAASAVTAYPSLVRRDAPVSDPSELTNIDYLVVGGGVGGLSLAVRLSENTDCTVAVVEAGPDGADMDSINIPGLKGSTIGTDVDWNFTTVPQENLNDRVISWPRGRVLGGSGALNLLVWDRASDTEYDAIGAAAKSGGWDAEGIIPYMKKTENYQQPQGDAIDFGATLDTSRLGEGGPVSFGLSPVIPEYQDGWIPAMNELNVKTNLKSLSGDVLGVSWQPTNVLFTNYTRAYSNPAYYKPNSGRDNLKVLVNTTVSGVEWVEGSSPLKAQGITWKKDDGTEGNISVNKEVILSAGSIGTPNILEYSGVGRRDVLEPLGIDVNLELDGVGENLHDHLRIQNVYSLKDSYTSLDRIHYDKAYAAEQLEIYRANNGTLSIYDYTASGYTFLTIDDIAPEKKDKLLSLAKKAVDSSVDENEKANRQRIYDFISKDNSSVPQVEIIFSDGYTGSTPVAERGELNSFSLIAALLHPFSRGNVHINTTDPLAKPVIDPKYFTDEYDIQMMTEIAKYMRKIAEQEAIAKYVDDEFEPGYDVVSSDDGWADWAYNTTNTVFHPVGTAAMLPKEENGVVDPASLKVYGTSNVRVADASIMPFIISGHIQTYVFAIAEKAAELITSS